MNQSQLACPKTGFSRRGFMIGIAGLTFAVATGPESFGQPATEAPDVSGTAFNPWVSIGSNGELSIMGTAPEKGERIAASPPADSGRGTGPRLAQGGPRAGPADRQDLRQSRPRHLWVHAHGPQPQREGLLYPAPHLWRASARRAPR